MSNPTEFKVGRDDALLAICREIDLARDKMRTYAELCQMADLRLERERNAAREAVESLVGAVWSTGCLVNYLSIVQWVPGIRRLMLWVTCERAVEHRIREADADVRLEELREAINRYTAKD